MEQYHDAHLDDNISTATTNDVEQCLNAFDRHLESERGCAPGTRAHYLHEARRFLVDVFPDLRANWEGLNADHVAGFVLSRAKRLSRLSQQGPVTAIRSLLRFLTFEGHIRTGLEGAVPPLRGSRHASIPRHSRLNNSISCSHYVRPTRLWISAIGLCFFCWPGWACVRERYSAFRWTI